MSEFDNYWAPGIADDMPVEWETKTEKTPKLKKLVEKIGLDPQKTIKKGRLSKDWETYKKGTLVLRCWHTANDPPKDTWPVLAVQKEVKNER